MLKIFFIKIHEKFFFKDFLQFIKKKSGFPSLHGRGWDGSLERGDRGPGQGVWGMGLEETGRTFIHSLIRMEILPCSVGHRPTSGPLPKNELKKFHPEPQGTSLRPIKTYLVLLGPLKSSEEPSWETHKKGFRV